MRLGVQLGAVIYIFHSCSPSFVCFPNTSPGNFQARALPPAGHPYIYGPTNKRGRSLNRHDTLPHQLCSTSHRDCPPYRHPSKEACWTHLAVHIVILNAWHGHYSCTLVLRPVNVFM